MPTPEQIEAAAAAIWLLYNPHDAWSSKHNVIDKMRAVDWAEAALKAADAIDKRTKESQ